MQTFIICGYGVPKDIGQDQNYAAYLRLAFNRIYDMAAGQEAALIPCGGPTNCEPPYQGTEAGIIAEYLRRLMEREEMRDTASRWRIIPEEESLSTLENLLFAKKIIQAEKLDGPITVFCEQTRGPRLAAFAERIFQDMTKNVYPIDFDISKNRYLDPQTIRRKEAMALEEGLWTLQAEERMQKHHELFVKKFEYLRRRQSEGLSHADAVKEWFENEKKIVRELMPEHPFLKGLED